MTNSQASKIDTLTRGPVLSRLTAALAVLLAVSQPLAADHCHDPGTASTPETAAGAEALGKMSIPDIELLDQDGNKVHFYSDLVAGRVVAMNFVFTTCTTICPPMGANFSKLQKLLAERTDVAGAEREVQLISISVDPAVDTPQRLEAWGRKFGRGPGWTLVTGSKPEVDRLLKALKVFTPEKEDHSPIVLLGDDAHGVWTRAYGLAPPAKLAEMVGELLATTVAGTRTGGTRTVEEAR